MNDLATQVAAKAYDSDDDSKQFDPITIAIIAQLIPVVLNLIQENCGEEDPVEISKRAQSPNARERLFLRWTLRRELGRRDFRNMGGSKLAVAMTQVAADKDNIPLMAAALESDQ